MKLHHKSRQSGFTLIELLAVVAVLGILAGIGVPRIFGALENARVGVDRANIVMLQSAVEQWGVIRNPASTLAGWESLLTDAPASADLFGGTFPADGVRPTGATSFVIVTTELVPNFINAVPATSPIGGTYQIVLIDADPAATERVVARVVRVAP